MFLKHELIAPARASALLKAAAAAARAIPPAFPLDATVACNPYLGQMNEDLAMASARLARVAGARCTLARPALAARVAAGEIVDQDLAGALAASGAADKPADLAALKAALGAAPPAPAALPTVADLAAQATGIDWPGVIARSVGLWAAGRFDAGQALWTPAPEGSAFAAWRAWGAHDLTPELAGLPGFCAHVAASPDTPERAILRASDALGLDEGAAHTAFHRLMMDLGGWAQHARYLAWMAELAGGVEATVTDLLAIRLIWEEALLASVPQVAKDWARVVEAHGVPLAPSADQVIDAILQDAAERAHLRGLAMRLHGAPTVQTTRPALQAAFCIDVRSEPFRRALESVEAGIETVAAAGFFGLPSAHQPVGSELSDAHAPALLIPGLTSRSGASAAAESDARITARAARAWGRFRQAAVSSFAFVEAAGPFYGLKLAKDALALGTEEEASDPAPQLSPELSAQAKADAGAAALRALSLAKGAAPLVLLLGHGAQVRNNPHESAYHCGACGGHTGAVSARLLARLLNDPETRAGLAARGVDLPADTLFVAGLHDTTTDEVTLHPDGAPAERRRELARAKRQLAQAGALTRIERARRLPGARADTLAMRARDWAELRPEWGLAGCASFVVAPRAVTARVDLGGRAFLHSYDWREDAGFEVLEMIMTAPVVVASWISLQYHGSSVAPETFGAGDKLIHNVTGGMGVVEGNGGRLRAGLPWQAVHDGERLMHEPLRLSVLIEAPQDAISAIIRRHDGLSALVENGWISVLTLESGRIAARCRPDLSWEAA